MKRCQRNFREVDLAEKVSENDSRAETASQRGKLAQTQGFEELLVRNFSRTNCSGKTSEKRVFFSKCFHESVFRRRPPRETTLKNNSPVGAVFLAKNCLKLWAELLFFSKYFPESVFRRRPPRETTWKTTNVGTVFRTKNCLNLWARVYLVRWSTY